MFISLSPLQQILSSIITTCSYLFPASTDLELKYYNRFVFLSPLQQIWSSSISTASYLFPRFNRSGAQVLQHVPISFPASTDMELKYYNRFLSLSPLQQIWCSSITTGSYLFPRFNRSGAQVLQQVRIYFPASKDLVLKYYNRFLSLSPLQQIWSSSITTASYLFPPLQQIWSSIILAVSYLFPHFNRSGAQVLQQVRISFPASTDLELKYYNRFLSLSPLQQIWSSSITTGSYLFPRFNRSGAQVLQQVPISFTASTDLELKTKSKIKRESPRNSLFRTRILRFEVIKKRNISTSKVHP